jgi:hypothetical protein
MAHRVRPSPSRGKWRRGYSHDGALPGGDLPSPELPDSLIRHVLNDLENITVRERNSLPNIDGGEVPGHTRDVEAAQIHLRWEIPAPPIVDRA